MEETVEHGHLLFENLCARLTIDVGMDAGIHEATDGLLTIPLR